MCYRYIVALAMIDGTDILLVGLSILVNLNTDNNSSGFMCW